jgi:hypothetical protein
MVERRRGAGVSGEASERLDSKSNHLPGGSRLIWGCIGCLVAHRLDTWPYFLATQQREFLRKQIKPARHR